MKINFLCTSFILFYTFLYIHQVKSSAQDDIETATEFVRSGTIIGQGGAEIFKLARLAGAFTAFGGVAELIMGFLVQKEDPVLKELREMEKRLTNEIRSLGEKVELQFKVLEETIQELDFKNNVIYPIKDGYSRLEAFHIEKSNSTFENLKGFCRNSPLPHEVFERLVDKTRLRGKTVIEASDFSYPHYEQYLKELREIVKLTVMLTSYCEVLNGRGKQQPNAHFMSVESNFQEVKKIVADDISYFENNYWPEAAHKLARRHIDSGGDNYDISLRIFQEAKKFTLTENGYQHSVFVYNGITGYNSHTISGENVIFQFRYNGKNYAIYRSKCNTPQNVVSESENTLKNAFDKYEEKIRFFGIVKENEHKTMETIDNIWSELRSSANPVFFMRVSQHENPNFAARTSCGVNGNAFEGWSKTFGTIIAFYYNGFD